MALAFRLMGLMVSGAESVVGKFTFLDHLSYATHTYVHMFCFPPFFALCFLDYFGFFGFLSFFPSTSTPRSAQVQLIHQRAIVVVIVAKA